MIEVFNNSCLVLITLALVYLSVTLYSQPTVIDTTAHLRINHLNERLDTQLARLSQDTNIRLVRLEGSVSARQIQQQEQQQ